MAGHQIPIDASRAVSVVLDGAEVQSLVNERTVVSLDIRRGLHTLELINSCSGASQTWRGHVVSPYLWGTYPNINFRSTKPPSRN